MTTAITPAAQATSARTSVARAFDPAGLLDRLDEEAVTVELAGIASDALTYRIKRDGTEVVGLSKNGVDECVAQLGRKGEAIRDEGLEWRVIDVEGESHIVAEVTVARYAIAADGREVKLDQAVGVKMQSLYYEAADEVTLDSPVPWGAHKGKKFRDVLTNDRSYLQWMGRKADDEALREFVTAILNGEEARMTPPRRKNPFWFEHAVAKAARNARLRLIPASIKAEILALAKESGRTRDVDASENDADRAAPPTDQTTTKATSKGPPTKVPFGNSKGKPLTECSTDHLTSIKDWCVKKGTHADLVYAIDGILDLRARDEATGQPSPDAASFTDKPAALEEDADDDLPF